MAWVPLDVAAKCILEVAFSTKPSHAVLNLSHPRPVRWNEMIDHVNNTIMNSRGALPLPMVPLLDWISTIRAARANGIISRADVRGSIDI